MKKSKVVLAVVLAIVFVIVCVNAPTFSWFTRPKDGGSGEKLMLQTKNTYTAYNGKNVTISTKSSTTGVAEPDSYTTEVSDSAGLSGSGIASYQRKYFCTTITNGSNKEQNVSLYARTLSIPTGSDETPNGTLAIGVNGPTRSFRDYTELADETTPAVGTVKRIYLETTNNVSGWQGTDFYICWGTGNSLGTMGEYGTYYQMHRIDSTQVYYADIPTSATRAFFAVANWGTNNNGQAQWNQRTPEYTNLGDQDSARDYKIKNSENNGNREADVYNVTPACFKNYYEHVFVGIGSNNTLNAKLQLGANFTGTNDSDRYYSGNTSVFTVDDTTGVITGVAAGDAKLYTKVKGGSYNDYYQVETDVTVTSGNNYEFNDVPIVKNIKIPASTENNANVVKVYWYVINNSSTNALTYTIDQVYLGL